MDAMWVVITVADSQREEKRKNRHRRLGGHTEGSQDRPLFSSPILGVLIKSKFKLRNFIVQNTPH
jgi:hypothetical protein